MQTQESSARIRSHGTTFTDMDPHFVSVDIETAGPSPSSYAMLAIGACLVADPRHSFYVELQPDRPGVDQEALRISGLSVERLTEAGVPAPAAMKRFAEWVESAPGEGPPIFVALNAPFDWMFVADYFHRYLGRNPFGHSAVDLKALYMGVSGASWSATSFRNIAGRYGLTPALPHHAGDDAALQAELFRRVMAEVTG